jgi:hypothetical protein
MFLELDCSQLLWWHPGGPFRTCVNTSSYGIRCDGHNLLEKTGGEGPKGSTKRVLKGRYREAASPQGKM